MKIIEWIKQYFKRSLEKNMNDFLTCDWRLSNKPLTEEDRKELKRLLEKLENKKIK